MIIIVEYKEDNNNRRFKILPRGLWTLFDRRIYLEEVFISIGFEAFS